jgi:hypothetical protein
MKTKILKPILLMVVTIVIAFSCNNTQDKETNSTAESSEKKEINSTTEPSEKKEINSATESSPAQMSFPEVTFAIGKSYEFFTRSTMPSKKGVFDRATKMTLLLDEKGTLNVSREEVVVGEKAANKLPQVHFLTETTLKLLEEGEQSVEHARADPKMDHIAYLPFSPTGNEPIFYRKNGTLKAVCSCVEFNLPPGEAGGSCTPEGSFCVQTCHDCTVSFVKEYQTYASRSVVVYIGPGSMIETISIK